LVNDIKGNFAKKIDTKIKKKYKKSKRIKYNGKMAVQI